MDKPTDCSFFYYYATTKLIYSYDKSVAVVEYTFDVDETTGDSTSGVGCLKSSILVVFTRKGE